MMQRPFAPEKGLLSGRKHALDGLRTVAVAAVFLFHTVTEFAPGGSMGVDVFFTLSGFVITLLIMKEYQATGRLRLGVFYAKRLARLWPALLIVCAFVAAVALLFPESGLGGQEAYAIPAAAYVMNLARAGLIGTPITGGALAPTWTLAVEEQFYLVWPLLLLLILLVQQGPRCRLDHRRLRGGIPAGAVPPGIRRGAAGPHLQRGRYPGGPAAAGVRHGPGVHHRAPWLAVPCRPAGQCTLGRSAGRGSPCWPPCS